jgi:hypothetical protein
MAFITIKDLPQSVELDRSAMLAIAGGARAVVRHSALTATALRGSGRIVDYPPGFGRDQLVHSNAPRMAS